MATPENEMLYLTHALTPTMVLDLGCTRAMTSWRAAKDLFFFSRVRPLPFISSSCFSFSPLLLPNYFLGPFCICSMCLGRRLSVISRNHRSGNRLGPDDLAKLSTWSSSGPCSWLAQVGTNDATACCAGIANWDHHLRDQAALAAVLFFFSAWARSCFSCRKSSSRWTVPWERLQFSRPSAVEGGGMS